MRFKEYTYFKSDNKILSIKLCYVLAIFVNFLYLYTNIQNNSLVPNTVEYKFWENLGFK